MKKIIAAAALLIALQGVAFAAGASGTALQSTGIKFTPSNNVLVFYNSDSTTSAQSYTINGKHTAGDRTYSTSNQTSNIWYTSSTAGTQLDGSGGITTAGATATMYSGWTAQ